jgi:hypothetical protein
MLLFKPSFILRDARDLVWHRLSMGLRGQADAEVRQVITSLRSGHDALLHGDDNAIQSAAHSSGTSTADMCLILLVSR